MSTEINSKLQEIKKAVEACGVIVSSISFNTSLKDVPIKVSPLPYIISLTLDVTFKLELQSIRQQKLNSSNQYTPDKELRQ